MTIKTSLKATDTSKCCDYLRYATLISIEPKNFNQLKATTSKSLRDKMYKLNYNEDIYNIPKNYWELVEVLAVFKLFHSYPIKELNMYGVVRKHFLTTVTRRKVFNP